MNILSDTFRTSAIKWIFSGVPSAIVAPKEEQVLSASVKFPEVLTGTQHPPGPYKPVA